MEKQRYKMGKNPQSFNFYGVWVSVTDSTEQDSWIIQQLALDFGYFSSLPDSSEFEIRFRPKNDCPPIKSFPIFSTRMCQVRQGIRRRICSYPGGTETHLAQKRATIYGSDLSEMYQAAYYLILSKVGEKLELLGYHRIHAVAIQREKVICYPMDSLGGKTSMALQEIFNGGGEILGDEIILTDGKKVYPFPVRMAVRPDVFGKLKEKILDFEKIDRIGAGEKYLVKIPPSKIGEVSDQWTLRLPQGWSRLSFAWRFFVGAGLPQMREFLLRPDNVFSLFTIFLSRFGCLIQMWKRLEPAAVP